MAKTAKPVARAVRNATSVIPWYFSLPATLSADVVAEAVSDVGEALDVDVMVPLELNVAESVVERAVESEEARDDARVPVRVAEPEGVAVGVVDIVH